jgi:hypothetical protein
VGWDELFPVIVFESLQPTATAISAAIAKADATEILVWSLFTVHLLHAGRLAPRFR